jgi:hypothetical protein
VHIRVDCGVEVVVVFLFLPTARGLGVFLGGERLLGFPSAWEFRIVQVKIFVLLLPADERLGLDAAGSGSRSRQP